MAEESEQGKSEAPPSRRTLWPIYAASFFSLSLATMNSLIAPLWALELGASPILIRVAVAARSVLPLILSIHSGVLMDRFGTRPIMVALAVVGAAASLLYPVLPSIAALIVLQLFIGFALNTVWIGAQTEIGRLTRGRTTYMGRFIFMAALGSFFAPLLAGACWDWFGPWGAFVAMAGWSIGLLISALIAPKAGPPPGADATAGKKGGALPRLSDYTSAFRMIAVPAVAFVGLITFLRSGTYGVINSFYPVYLDSIEISGTEIGILLGVSSLIGSPAALLVAPLERFVRAHWLLILTTAASIVFLCATPLFETFPALIVLALLYGTAAGIGFPLLLSVLSRAVSIEEQGLSVGLRITLNRAAVLMTPLVMGLIVERFDLAASFYAVGVALLLLSVLTTLFVLRSPAFNARRENS